MVFIKKLQYLEKKFFNFFYFIEFFNVINAPQKLKGSQNIKGLALIRAVLFLSRNCLFLNQKINRSLLHGKYEKTSLDNLHRIYI